MTAEQRCPHCVEECEVGYGVCHCGCGAPADIIKSRGYRNGVGVVVHPGEPCKYVRGHWVRTIQRADPPLPEVCQYCGEDCEFGNGVCHCGCGEQVEPHRGRYPRYLGMHRNGLYRLTAEDVRYIRYLYAVDEHCSQPQLARQYGVSQQTINKIVRFITWKHVGIYRPEEAGGPVQFNPDKAEDTPRLQQLLVEGFSDEEIAEDLDLSLEMVKARIGQLLKISKVESRTEYVMHVLTSKLRAER